MDPRIQSLDDSIERVLRAQREDIVRDLTAALVNPETGHPRDQLMRIVHYPNVLERNGSSIQVIPQGFDYHSVALPIFGDYFTPIQLPMDGPFPAVSARPVYQEIGKMLSSADVGKRFVRVYPHGDPRDWDYVPCSTNPDHLLIAQIQLIEITAKNTLRVQRVFNQLPITTEIELDASWNDGCWTPVETYQEHAVLKEK